MRSIYIRAKQDICQENGEPVEIGGQLCRFKKGKAYEIPVLRQAEFVVALEAHDGVEILDANTGGKLVDDQDAKIRADKAAAKEAAPGNIDGAGGEVGATVETGAAPA